MHNLYSFVRLQKFLLRILPREVYLSSEYLQSAYDAHSTLLGAAKKPVRVKGRHERQIQEAQGQGAPSVLGGK